MQINLIYNASVNNAPAAFKPAMVAAAQYLDQLIADPITVNIDVGYGEIDNFGVSSPVNYYWGEGLAHAYNTATYAELRQYLTSNSTSPDDITALDHLSATDPTNGGTFWLSGAQAKAWGLLPAAGTELDGSVGFSSSVPFDYNGVNNPVPSGQIDFFGTATHELNSRAGSL